MRPTRGEASIRILLVEDHTIVREGTRQLLEAEPDMTVVGEAAEADEAIDKADALWPDVVLLDLRLAGGSSGLTAARGITRVFPNAAMLVLTAMDDPEYVRAAMRAGVRGYLLKTASATEIVEAIRTVHSGGSVLDPAIAEEVEATEPRPPTSNISLLSSREMEVFRLLGCGTTNAEIADALGLSARTVEGHVSHILFRLNLPSRAAAIALAAREIHGG